MVARDKLIRALCQIAVSVSIGVGTFALLPSKTAFADETDDDRKRAETLFNEARAAVTANDYATACPKFEESLKLARRAGTLFNLAQCEEHEGRLVTAVQYYKEGIVVLEPGDPRLGPSKKQLASIEPRLPYLTVKLQGNLPPGGRVTLNGREIEAFDKEFPVNPGRQILKVLAPKHADEVEGFFMAEAARDTKIVKVGARLPDPLPPKPTKFFTPQRIAAFSAFGVGAVGFVGAAITGGLVVSAHSRMEDGCSETACLTAAGYEASKTGRSLLIANTVAWGVGIAGAGVGTFLLLYKGKRAPSKPRADHSFVIGPGFVGVQGSF
jgi:hypothetical protein